MWAPASHKAYDYCKQWVSSYGRKNVEARKSQVSVISQLTLCFLEWDMTTDDSKSNLPLQGDLIKIVATLSFQIGYRLIWL